MSQVNESNAAGLLSPNPVYRPLETVDLNRTVSAFPGLEVVGELDDVLKQPLEVTMMEDWSAYFNAHIMLEAANYYAGRITHWRFLPDPATSQIVLVQAQSEKEYGATEVKYSETEAGTLTNLRRPMQSLGVQRHAGRVWSFPLVVRKGADGKEYLAITLKGATTRPVVSKKKKNQAAGTAPAGTTAPAGGTAGSATPAPAETASSDKTAGTAASDSTATKDAASAS
ncbi:MAG TPA: hypothetical protein VD973_04540 [Symbiobacteriaceae bacterium]|nr:hypothetical protein [Symbiobacteriaceae bacterium]